MIKYELDELRSILYRTVSLELRHKYYGHCVDLAKRYRQYMTGDDQAELVLSYKPRESETQKEQRVSITNSRTQYVNNKVVSVFKKVPRTDNIVNNIYYDGDTSKDGDARLALLQEQFNDYYKGLTLRDYVTETFEYFSFYDPNAWILSEFRKLMDGKIKTYPIEATSEQAVMYEWDLNTLQYLVVRFTVDVYEKEDKKGKKGDAEKLAEAMQQIDKMTKMKPRGGERIIMYAPGHAIELIELAEKQRADMGLEQEQYPDAEIIEIPHKQTGKTKRYAKYEYVTGTKVTPAFQIGYIRDPDTNRETFVSPLHPSDKVLKDLINTKSEYDLAKALHGFIQKIQYAPVCDYEREYEGRMERCHHGKMQFSQTTCTQCQGLGLKIHRSTQDAILVKWPDGKEEHIPLDQAIHYVLVPDYIIKMWKEELTDLERAVSLAVFNTNLFDRSEVAVTATEKRLNMESAYDVLMDYADQSSALYKFQVTMTADYLSIADGLVIDHRYPSTFGLETTDDLLLQRKTATDAGAPYQIISEIDMQIYKKQNQDSPENLRWIQSRERFRPFREKTIDEKMFILADLPEDDPRKVLYINFEDIMDRIEEEKPKFHLMSHKEQRKIVTQEVTRIIAEKFNRQDAPVFDENDPQSKLRGSVGGVTGLVDVASAVADGRMTEEAGREILLEIYGLSEEVANKIVSVPSTSKRATEAAAKTGELQLNGQRAQEQV